MSRRYVAYGTHAVALMEQIGERRKRTRRKHRRSRASAHRFNSCSSACLRTSRPVCLNPPDTVTAAGQRHVEDAYLTLKSYEQDANTLWLKGENCRKRRQNSVRQTMCSRAHT